MTENALALIEEKNVAQYFVAKGLDPIIDKIRREVMGVVSDISTAKGRDEIRSRAHKVAKSKTALDDMGKKLVSGIKEQAKAIDAERSRAWDAIEAIQHEVRAPLTEWENKEKSRLEAHEQAICLLNEQATFLDGEPTAEIIEKRIARLIEIGKSRDWHEFAQRAEATHKTVYDSLVKKLDFRRKQDEEEAELARLRQEETERRQKEHEERLKAEAAAKAKQEAETAAKAQAEALAAKVKAEQDAAAKREETARREKAEAEDRARKAEEARIAAETKADAVRKDAAEKARINAIAAEEKAKQEAEAAAKRERDKIEAERKAEAEAVAKREADKKHRAKINNEVLDALILALHDGSFLDASITAKAIVEAIAKGQVPHVKIQY